VVFILLKGDLDLRLLGRYCDSFVGLFMIFLGCYGVLGALKTFKEKRKKKDSDSTMKHLHSVVNGNGGINSNSSSSTLCSHNLNITNLPIGADGSYVVMRTELDEPQSDDIYGFLADEHRSEFILPCPACLIVDMHDPFTQRVLSFSIGLLHGVAGPGGILGVLPAVEMRNWRSSVLYLGSFILTSTLSMGTFAALYGEVTKRLGATAESVELALSVFSASMSIIVGTIWLVLSLLGKLQRLFH
jgi:hypothetical protein